MVAALDSSLDDLHFFIDFQDIDARITDFPFDMKKILVPITTHWSYPSSLLLLKTAWFLD